MSVEMEMHVERLSELRQKLSQLDDGLKRHVQEAMQFEAEAMKNVAKASCPVRTGRLRDSIYAKVQNWIIRLGAAVPYAVYQEFGTRYIRGRCFLSKAVEVRMPVLVNRLNSVIDQAIREAESS
jgi:HK97 gp10 family phage protein